MLILHNVVGEIIVKLSKKKSSVGAVKQNLTHFTKMERRLIYIINANVTIKL